MRCRIIRLDLYESQNGKYDLLKVVERFAISCAPRNNFFGAGKHILSFWFGQSAYCPRKGIDLSKQINHVSVVSLITALRSSIHSIASALNSVLSSACCFFVSFASLGLIPSFSFNRASSRILLLGKDVSGMCRYWKYLPLNETSSANAYCRKGNPNTCFFHQHI